ncbi:MAG TPA: PLP-dependent aminotransferase family protein [Thermoanaerobaculia bacterium]|nr:PLP-dependent aminotransferase family protein [Thermoanaerobaculia bacterium]
MAPILAPGLAGSASAAPAVNVTPWEARFAQRTHGMTSSIIRELLKLTEAPDLISFAGGLPASQFLPRTEIGAAVERIVASSSEGAFQYGVTEGYRPLRELFVRHMARYGIHVGPENVLVTSGSQQALDLIARLFINPGDRILTEQPTYLGAIQAFGAQQGDFLPVPTDDDGLLIESLEEKLRAGPKFLYILPNFQNPGGTTLSLPRRRRLVELANHYGTPIVEDDPYGQLRYEGDHLAPLVTLDAEIHGCASGERAFTGNVIYLSTLSKTLAPGLRIGWVVAPESVVRKLAQIKQAADLHTSTFCQHVAYEVAREGFLDRHVKRLRAVYGVRRDAMLEALARHFPRGLRWTKPQGGLFLWATAPKGIDTGELLKDALAEKVAFVPGAAFYPDGGGHESMRLNFSYATPDVIEEGVRRLGRVLSRALEG